MSSFAIETLLPSTEVVHSYAINLNPLSPGSLGPSRLTIVRQMIHVNGEDEPAEKRAVLVIEKNGTELWSKVLVRAIEVHGISGPPAEQPHVMMQLDVTIDQNVCSSPNSPIPPNDGSLELYLFLPKAEEVFNIITTCMDEEDAIFGGQEAGFDFGKISGGYRDDGGTNNYDDGSSEDGSEEGGDCAGEVVVFPREGGGDDVFGGGGEEGFDTSGMITADEANGLSSGIYGGLEVCLDMSQLDVGDRGGEGEGEGATEEERAAMLAHLDSLITYGNVEDPTQDGEVCQSDDNYDDDGDDGGGGQFDDAE